MLLNILLALKVSEDLGKVTYTLTLPYGYIRGDIGEDG
jgi:hypothetical protein